MWFEDDEVTGRRRWLRGRRGARPAILRVNARVKGGKGQGGVPRGVVFALAAVAALGAAALLWLGGRAAGQQLFSRNGAFTLRVVDISGAPTLGERLVREYMPVTEGMNLFEFDIRQIRRDFLRRTPSVRSMEMRRVLPDRLEVALVEREPLVRFGWNGPLVADRQGVLFVHKGTSRRLPVLTGYRGTELRPGTSVRGLATAALELLDYVDSMPTLGLTIDAVDVGPGEHLVVWVAGQKSVKLAWKQMGSLSAASREHLGRRLAEVVAALQSEQGRRLPVLDATVDGRIFGR